MIDLPSRKDAEAWLHTSAGSGYGRRFVQAYVSGQLVDREVIEDKIRKAIMREVDEWADSIVAAIGNPNG